MGHQLKKIVSICLVCIFLAVLFLAQIFIITHIDHDCNGEGCPICAEIHFAEVTLQQLTNVIQTIALFVAFICFTTINILIPKGISLFNSQVKLKVRMNE
jgi:hypothetical protein